MKKFQYAKTFNILLTFSLTIGLLAGCGKEEVTAPLPKPVNTVLAKLSTLSTTVEYSCKLKPINEISVFPKQSGRVSTVKFDVGDLVNQNDILFTLDSREIESQIEQQKAGVGLSQANLSKTASSSYEQQASAAEQSLSRAKTSFDSSKYAYDKTLAAYQKSEVPKETLIDAEVRYKNAEIELKASKDNLNLLKEKSAPESLDIVKAQYRQSQAALNTSYTQLENTIVRSPISGIVLSRNADVGEMTSNATPSFVIINSKELLAEVNVSDKIVSSLKLGQSIPIKVNNLGNKSIDGVIENISPASDEKTQTYMVRMKIVSPDNSLKPGMLARAVIVAESKENVLTVPNETIKIENGVQYLYVVEFGKVKKNVVTTGIFNSEQTEIKSGISNGAIVITEGQIFLNEGQAVTVVKNN